MTHFLSTISVTQIRQDAPAWMSYVALGLGIFNLIVITSPYIYYYFFRSSNVLFRLSRDCFYRIVDSGECLFINGSLIAETSPALIHSVEVSLQRSGTSMKDYPLRIIRFGTLVQRFTLEPQHFFYSTSPYKYLAIDEVFIPLWMASITEYMKDIETLFREYDGKVVEIKNKNSAAVTKKEDGTFDYIQELKDLVIKYHDKIANKVQIEGGEYTLTSTVEYQPLGGYFSRKNKKKSKSALKFTVENEAKELLLNNLRIHLYHRAVAHCIDPNFNLKFPEYLPRDIEEIETRTKTK